MPQMSPLNWLFLFILFSITFLLINMINYYYFNNKSSLNFLNKSSKMIQTFWKW